MSSQEFPFSITELNFFLAICEEGSITGAARRLRVSQPAVSVALSELENRLGVQLLDRSVRPIALRPAGAVLRQRASALLSEARQIAPMMRTIDRGKLPLLRIGIVDSFARLLSGPLSATAAELAEEVAVFSGLTSFHASALLTRNLDIMIGLDDLADVPGLERWPLLVEPYILVLSPELEAPLKIEDLHKLSVTNQFVRYSARSNTGADIDRQLRRLGLSFPRRLEFDTPHGLLAPVMAGGSFAITTPVCLLESGATPGQVRCAMMPGPVFTRRVTAVARGDHKRAARTVVDRIKRELRDTMTCRLNELSPLLPDVVQISN